MYVKITSGSVDTFPYSVGQLRRDNPNTSFPRQIASELLEDYGVYPVTIDDQPSYDDRTQTVAQNATPTGSGSTWTLGWTTTAKTAEETQEYDDNVAASNRGKRSGLLAETDFWGMSDMTMSAEMTTYRQALRDITTHSNWPNLADGDWPTKP
jgi:hypothetical protein